MDLTDYIIKELEKSGVRQIHLSRITGISNSKLSNFLNRRGGLYPNEVVSLLHALGFRITLPEGTQVVMGKPEFNLPVPENPQVPEIPPSV